MTSIEKKIQNGFNKIVKAILTGQPHVGYANGKTIIFAYSDGTSYRVSVRHDGSKLAEYFPAADVWQINAALFTRCTKMQANRLITLGLPVQYVNGKLESIEK